MDALNQYIELFENHHSLVDDWSDSLMNSYRDDALQILKRKGLPKHGSENYEVSDLNEMLSPDFGLNLARIEIDADPRYSFHCGVPSLKASLFFQTNDIFHPDCHSDIKLPEGIKVISLKDFCQKNPEKALKYYNRIADIGNPLVALNTLFAQDGICIIAERDTKSEFPIQLVNILHNGMPLMAVRRILIILEDNAEIKLMMCDHSQDDSIDYAILRTIEIYAGNHSKLHLYDLEESSEKTRRLSSLYLHQEAHSDVLIEGITLYNGVSRNEYFSEFKGKESRLRLLGMGIIDKERKLDTYTRVEHLVEECETDELFKYVLDNNSRGGFTGLIKVNKGAKKTTAYQNNRNIVANSGAKMYSKPELEIYDDDVKCSHGCAIGQIDENQIFYMQTRGIPQEEAKFLLKQAFMSDVIDKVDLPGLRERLITLVEKRFAGEPLNCSGCSECSLS